MPGTSAVVMLDLPVMIFGGLSGSPGSRFNLNAIVPGPAKRSNNLLVKGEDHVEAAAFRFIARWVRNGQTSQFPACEWQRFLWKMVYSLIQRE
jgi:hypothetical protein